MVGFPDEDKVVVAVHPGLVQQLWVLPVVSPVEWLPPIAQGKDCDDPQAAGPPSRNDTLVLGLKTP